MRVLRDNRVIEEYAPAHRTVCTQRQLYGGHASPRLVRRAWAAVTTTPNASMIELARQIDASWSGVAITLHILRDAGYIDFEDRAVRARRIIVPFVVEALRLAPDGLRALAEDLEGMAC